MRKRSRAVFVAAMIVGSAILTIQPASALSSQESSFVSLVNRERSSRGIARLSVASDLTTVARRHSARMAADGTIYHNPRLTSEVDGWRAIAENVGKGPSVDSIHRAFMNSSAHRVHILDRDFDQIGVGTVIKDDVIYVTEIFVDRASAKQRTVTKRTAPAVHRVIRVAKPAPKRAPAPPARAEPQTVAMLLSLAGLDADVVDPRTGVALAPPHDVTLRQTPT